MMHTINGSCHCGILSFVLETDVSPELITARACECNFCRIHGAKNWSDPNGKTEIHVRDPKRLQRYRFALRTADFFICMTCGAYIGAVLFDDKDAWSTVNLRLSSLDVAESSAGYGSEDLDGRIARRKRNWTPTIVTLVT